MQPEYVYNVESKTILEANFFTIIIFVYTMFIYYRMFSAS